MPILHTLKNERTIERFKQRVRTALNMLEYIDEIESDDDVSSDYLMWLHFDKDAAMIRTLLNDAAVQGAAAELAPWITAAAEVADALDRLHPVRNTLLQPYLRADQQDIHQDRIERGLSEDDQALGRGMTKQQLHAYKAQLDKSGHLKLSKQEIKTLKNAIRKELGRPEKP